VDIKPELAKGNHTVPAAFSVDTELVGEGNKCDGSENPSHGAGDVKQEPIPCLALETRGLAMLIGFFLYSLPHASQEKALSAVAHYHASRGSLMREIEPAWRQSPEMRTPNRSHQMITF